MCERQRNFKKNVNKTKKTLGIRKEKITFLGHTMRNTGLENVKFTVIFMTIWTDESLLYE